MMVSRVVLLLFSCLFLEASLGQEGVKVEDYRLPRDVESISYNLTLEPDIGELVFRGTLVFTFKSKKSSSRLILNSKNLLIDPSYVVIEDTAGNNVGLSGLEEQKELERLIVTPAVPFSKGNIYSILFKYQGNITEDGTGLYRTNYTDHLGVNQWMLASQMRPVYTRQVFPCLDEPSFRARFRLTVWHHPSYFVVSNMPPVHTTLIGSEAAVTEFGETPSIPVFLTGVMVSRLGAVEGTDGFTSLAVPQEVPAVAYSAEIGPKMAAAMESLVRLEYPQFKTHQVALPKLLPIAMENWGLFNFRKENILYAEGVDPTVQRQTVARFSGHEISHAWLGNSVTIAWWDYLWQSEMFAMYLEYFLPHLVDPTWRMEEQMVVDLHMSGLAGDSPSADPLTTSVLTPQQITAKFMGLTYTKGPGLLRMVIHSLGINKFFKGIRAYLEAFWEKSVTPRDLWATLEREGTFPTKLETIMSTWTEQPGYPLVTVTYKQGAAQVSQSPYSPDGSKSSNASWWIPLSYATTQEPVYDSKPKVWLPPGHTVTIPLPSESLILINVLSSGFFRINYDTELLSRLRYQLHADHTSIPPLNRAQLIDDSLALAASGHLGADTALDLVSYLAAEQDFIVWKAASVSLMTFADLIVNTEIYPLYKSFVLSLVNKVFTARGLIDLPQDRHIDRVQREIVVGLACRMGNQDCINAANEYVAAVSHGQPVRVSPDVRQAFWCTAVQEGDSKVLKYVLSLFNKGGANKAQYLSALGCSKDPELMKMLLITSESSLTDDEWNARYSAFSSRRENSNNLFNLLHQNIDKMISRFGTKGLSGFIGQISKFLVTKKQNDLVGDFERLGVGNLASTRSSIHNKGAWLTANVPSIIRYFKSNKKFALILH